jgi:hypothetical protein
VKHLFYIANMALKQSIGDRADKLYVVYRNVRAIISYSR